MSVTERSLSRNEFGLISRPLSLASTQPLCSHTSPRSSIDILAMPQPCSPVPRKHWLRHWMGDGRLNLGEAMFQQSTPETSKSHKGLQSTKNSSRMYVLLKLLPVLLSSTKGMGGSCCWTWFRKAPLIGAGRSLGDVVLFHMCILFPLTCGGSASSCRREDDHRAP